MPKTINIKPVAQTMDARSSPEDLQLSAYRYLLNWGLTAKGKMCRATGFDRHLTRTDYNNQDLHDQLLSSTGISKRLPVTMLFEATSVRKSTKLIAGTGKALYALNNSTGNWKVISDLLGSETARWKAALLNDTVLFTNNLNDPVYWHYDQGINDIAVTNQSVSTVPDLLSIGISKAGVVVSWKNTMFLMNVVVNGSTKGGTIFWSNFERPLDWIPSDASTAGNADLAFDETILAAMPLSNRLIIYTNKGIWEVLAVGGDQVFQFNKRYDPQAGESCLHYPNTLISTGNEHVYLGQDGIYVYDLYQEKPQRVDWMHKASSIIFNNINDAACEVHCAGYNTAKKEFYFSWARQGESLPTQTMSFYTEAQFASVLDYGFSAFVTYTLKEPIQALRDFLLDKCICTDAELTTIWGQFTKEGQFCTPPSNTTCSDPPVSIFTSTPLNLGDGVITEDYTQSTADANSLCAQLGDLSLSDLCQTEESSDECNSGKRFVVASSSDYCLKEFSDGYYREECTDFSVCGRYSKRGYKTLVRSGPISLDETKNDKVLSRLELEASSVIQSTPSQFNLRIGLHSQAVDPNDDGCGIVWKSQKAKPIKCQGSSASVSATNHTVPAQTYEWPLYYEGRYVYFELEIANPNVTPTDTGGGCCISRISLDMDVRSRQWMG